MVTPEDIGFAFKNGRCSISATRTGPSKRRHRLQRRKYRNPGPNYVWHIDGHDKLKPYGLSIHGYIDGYSRRIIWLEVASTNKVPELIAKYYLDALKQILGKPKFVKADNGTEHSIIELLHTLGR